MEWLKERLSLVAAIGSAISLLFSGVVWANSYFARVEALEYVKCVSEGNDRNLTKQMSATAKYIEYQSLKGTLASMKGDVVRTSMGDQDDLKRKMEEAYRASRVFLEEAKAAEEGVSKCGNMLL